MGANKKILASLAIILALAGFFRFWQLAQIPPGLYPDVAINGNDALQALETNDFKIFYPENNGREGLFINLIALSFRFFGASILAIKIVPAIIGFLTVLGLYLFARSLFTWLGRNKSELIAILSSFFLAVSFWHVNFSRLGFRAIMVPFCLVWSFYFLSKALAKNRQRAACPNPIAAIIYFILAGAFFGLGFHTYIAFRVAPLILIPVLFFEIADYWPRLKELWKNHSFFSFLKQSCLKDGWWRWKVFFAAIFLVALPIGIYFWQHPADFVGRSGQVSIFASQNPVKSLAESAAKTLGQFVVYGDGNQRHNISGSPEIFWPLIPFFLIGFIYSLVQIFSPKNYREKKWPALSAFWMLLVWWSAMLLPSIMTNEGLPHALRSIGAIPPSYIFTGFGFFLFVNFLRTRIQNINFLRAVYCLLFVSTICLAAVEYYRYFIYWGQDPETRGAFTEKFVEEGEYLNSLPADIQKYVIVNENGVSVPYPDGIPMPAQTIMFVSHNTPGIIYLKETQIGEIDTRGRITVLPMEDDEFLFKKLEQKFPAGKKEKINDFSIFKINQK